MHRAPPPVPARLREMLKDYPGHIEQLQGVLARSVERSRRLPLMPYDDAISALEGRLETFIFEARDELKVAEMSDDPLVVAAAQEKWRLMRMARSGGGGMLDISDLAEYFERQKDRF